MKVKFRDERRAVGLRKTEMTNMEALKFQLERNSLNYVNIYVLMCFLDIMIPPQLYGSSK